MSFAFAPIFVLQLLVSAEPYYRAELIFPPHPKHNHAPGIVELSDGQLLASWYRGSGERSADDVAVYGARMKKGADKWSDPFVMADMPGFPDCNTCMMVDAKKRVWLFWPIVVANSWESAITTYRVSADCLKDGPPVWSWQGIVLLKPKDFQKKMDAAIARERSASDLKVGARETLFIAQMKKLSSDKLLQRLGWQPRCKPTILPSGRILLPLYSDTYSAGIMAISDDGGETWFASDPILGMGNIQPTVLRRNDGLLIAYMRENGPRQKIRVSESKDDGMTWGPVTSSELPNPGAGIDGVRLANGHWVLIYNDSTKGRSTLAVAISTDEGKTWPRLRHLETDPKGRYHYPVIIQAADGTIHAVYTYNYGNSGSSMKHAAFNEEWLGEGDRAAK